MHQRLCSVSVDLDPLRCYYQIHGLGEPPAGLTDVVLKRALPRFLDLFARHRLQSTLFVVGSDLVGDAAKAGRLLLKEAAAAGHELGNHSFSHHYDLARRSRAEMEREVGDAHQALRSLLGRPPVGFRSPGYDLSPELVEVLESFAYQYDSSLFPCPPYYLAKLAVLGKMALFRQKSGAIIGSPRAQLAPTQPYRPDPQHPWRSGQACLVELPVAVTPWLRLPAIGSSVLLSAPLRWLVLRGMNSQPYFNFELHGMDLLDADEDGLPDELRLRQVDLRVPLAERMRALDEVLTHMRQNAQPLPLFTVADQVQLHGHVQAPTRGRKS